MGAASIELAGLLSKLHMIEVSVCSSSDGTALLAHGGGGGGLRGAVKLSSHAVSCAGEARAPACELPGLLPALLRIVEELSTAVC